MRRCLLACALRTTALLGTMFVAAACPIRGSGEPADETRSLDAFTAVDVDGSIDVFVHVGEAPGAKLHGDANILPMVKTDVVGDRLHVFVDGSYMTTNKLSVHVTTESLERISVDGSSDVKADGIDAESLAIEVSGSGDVTAIGKAAQLQVRVSGSGDVDALALPTGKASVSVSGSGDAAVNVDGPLDVAISGSGDVSYRGNPTSIDKSVSGSGDVRAL